MSQGVPQGSILGPLLFSIYVSDMHAHLKYCKLQQYADDSQMYLPFSEDELQTSQIKFNFDLNQLNSFALDHNLKLNPAKSSIIFLGGTKLKLNRISENFIAEINNVPLPKVTEVKNLGIFLDSELSFQTHIKHKLSIAYMRLRKLWNIKKYVQCKTKYFLCNSLVLSIMDYGDVVYGSSLTAEVSRSVQKLQNACLRFSYNITYREHITPHLNRLAILTMSNRRKYHLSCFIHKILKTGQPTYLRSLFYHNQHIHNTRHLNKFSIPQHNSSKFQKSFSFKGVKLWNELPDDLKNLTIIKFMKLIKFRLLSEQNMAT